MHQPISLARTAAQGCVRFRDNDNALWLGATDGSILSVRLLDRRILTHGQGYQNPVAVLPADDGLSLYVVEAAGAILQAPRQTTSRAAATLITDLGRPLVAADLAADGNAALVLEAGADARLLTVDLATGGVTVVAELAAAASAIVVNHAAGAAVVLQGLPGAHELVRIDLVSGVVGAPVGVAGSVSSLVLAPGGSGVILGDVTGTLSEVDVAGTPGAGTANVGAPVLALARWGSLVLAVTAAAVHPLEWHLEEGPVTLGVPLGPVITNGYANVDVDLGASGLAWGDILLDLEDGPEAGIVSAAVAPPTPTGARRVRVVASPFPGERALAAIRIADGKRVGRARLRVVRHWPDDDVGPPVAFTGPYRTLASWGGGPAGPENIRKHAAPDTWRVAFVFVAAKDRGFQEALATARPTWEGRLVGGGATAQRYFEEVSFRNTAVGGSSLAGTTIALADSGISGVVAMQSGWGDLFENDDTDKITPNPFGGWKVKPDGRHEIAGAYCDMLIDAGTAATVLPKIDAVVFVIQNASEDVVKVGDRVLRARFCWPQAWQGVNFHWKGPTWTTIVAKPCVFMPTAYPTGQPPDPSGLTKSFTNILCHELGHTLGCGDLYNNGDYGETVDARLVGALDLMGNDWWLPHFSLPNRMRLGWIDPAWIESIDFGATPTSRTVTLQAAETLLRAGPPPGRRAGIEIRIRPGRNYYFEYRRMQGAAQVGDNGLNRYYPTSQMLVGSDVVGDGVDPIARPDILLLPTDADGDGPVLFNANTDYSETDVTDPERQHDFRLVYDQVEPADANALRVRVDYVRAHRAELQISPAPGRKPPGPPDWKSPDIDLEGPAGNNVIAKGHWHTIVARVRNGGTVDAENVRIEVYTKAFTTTVGGAIRVLPAAPAQTIPKQQTREFRLKWYCPEHTYIDRVEVEHYCIRVEIDRYVDPRDPSRNEIVVHNNAAQSNFDTTSAAHASPSERRTTGLIVENELARRATYQIAVDQDSAAFRTYVSAAWTRLGGGASRALEVAYESLAGDPLFGDDFDTVFHGSDRAPVNALALTSLLAPPEGGPGATAKIVFGANLNIRAGLRTAIRDVDLLGEVVRGAVIEVGDGGPQPVTFGRVNVVLWLARRPEDTYLAGDAVDGAGTFNALTPREIREAFGREEIMGEAFYLGAGRWAPSRSGIRRLG